MNGACVYGERNAQKEYHDDIINQQHIRIKKSQEREANCGWKKAEQEKVRRKSSVWEEVYGDEIRTGKHLQQLGRTESLRNQREGRQEAEFGEMWLLPV